MLVAGYNYFSNHKLQISYPKLSKKISILIPVRNEEKNILALLQTITEQSYTNYEVIVLDDDSSDNTYSIVKDFISERPQFSISKGQRLPSGWTGKNYACWQLANKASGAYLLFLDADVQLSPELLGSLLNYASERDLSLLSLFSTQDMFTSGEKAIVPLMNYMLLTLLPIRLIGNHTDPIFSAACGQLMLFKATDYQKHQWHKALSDEITEDLKIIKSVKKHGFKVDALLADQLLSCRMYSTYEEAVSGFSKNFITPFNNSIPLFCLYLLTITIAPLTILMSGNLTHIITLSTLVIMTRYFTSAASGQSVVMNLLYHPIQMANLLIIGSVAIINKQTNAGVWKGRKIGNKLVKPVDTNGLI